MTEKGETGRGLCLLKGCGTIADGNQWICLLLSRGSVVNVVAVSVLMLRFISIVLARTVKK